MRACLMMCMSLNLYSTRLKGILDSHYGSDQKRILSQRNNGRLRVTGPSSRLAGGAGGRPLHTFLCGRFLFGSGA